MNDKEKIISGYLSIADMLMRMKETSLIEDPMVISQLKKLQIAMADLNSIIGKLEEAEELHRAVKRRFNPRLYLVERFPKKTPPKADN
ncbi:hypothetical protein M3R28_08860 [Pseudomonas syringae]|uniref:hypothetical protein n=1 Tax=Pseudomonas syringae TaxID=317 RepID=UPI0020BFDD62|nr:hypothetical protein [Pseudomonas syringae]MCL6307011.1 hypothetical protein [Pseudomonas syringae]